MTSFDYHLNPLYPTKECSSRGALYTTDYCCSEGNLRDKIICDPDQTPDLSKKSPQDCPKCGHRVNGHYSQGCALLRKKFKEDLFTSCIEHGILQDSSEPSNDNTNVVNAPREPFVVNQDPGKNSSQSPPQINCHCCYGCGDPLEEQEANARYWKFPACYDDDDDDYTFAITPNEPVNSLNFPKEIYSNPLFDEEIISIKIDPHHFNVESDLIKSMLNHDSSIISSSKIDSLFDEFAGELTLLKSIPSGIDETDCYPEEETHFIKRLFLNSLEDNIIFELLSYSAVTPSEPIDSLSMGDEHLNTIPTTESDEFIKSCVENLVPNPKIDLSFNLDDPMPPGIEDDDYDSRRDIPILEKLLDNYSLSLPANESYHFDVPSPYRPPTKPPDGKAGTLNIKMMGDVSDRKGNWVKLSDLKQALRGRHPMLIRSLVMNSCACIPGNVKTHAKGFCTPVFISSASVGNHISKSNRTNVYLIAYLINGLRLT
nr:hypothetical protein [Tanacetum cinerariifolium]